MDKYQRPVNDSDLLGKGGNCVGVERWRVPATKGVVAAKLVERSASVRREKEALRLANAAKVSRVVKFIDDIIDPSKGHWLILEVICRLLDGVPLFTYFRWRAKQRFYEAAEARMIAAAAALTETLYELHHEAKLAHLDISPANIMLLPEASSDWDKLCLLDFGLAEPFQPAGPCSNCVTVPGSTYPWAAPEVLQSLSSKRSDRHYIDGAAADMWSAGAVLYYMLTGGLPFPVRDRTLSARARRSRSAARKAQESWVKSVRLAEGNNTAVDHPLLDKARAFSSTPNAAASFFSAILHPSPTKRLTSAQALQHPYLRRCVQQMQASYCTSRQTKLGAALTIPISDSPPLVELAHTHGRGFLSTLVSVPSSGLKMMKSLVGHALPGGSSRGRTACLIDAARYFPKYVHASSDAELSTQLSPQLSLERQSREPPSELSPEPQPGVGQLMAGINELRTDFSLRPAIAGAFNPTTAMLQAPQTSKHAKASIDRGFAAAALQMPRQRYPASPLSAASPQCLLHDEQPQLGPVKRTDSQDASSGLIPAIHSVRAQPANPCDGLSDVAAGKQQHVVTPADEAAGARQTPVVSDPRPHSEPGSTQAGPSKQRLVQAQQSSADKHAAADAASTTQLCNPVLEAAKAVEDGLQSAQVPVVPAFSHQVQVIEQEQSGAPDIPQAEQSPKAEQSLQAEQSSRLFAAVAVHAAGNCSNRTSGDGNAGSAPAGQLVRQKLLSSHPIDVLSETEDDLGGAQPIEPLQSPLIETIAQAHPQPLNQHSSTSKHAEDVAVGLCVKPLKSHILHYCPVKDQDLDLIDTHVEEGTGAGSICNGIGVEHAANAPAYFSSQSPYLSADVPAAQAQTRSVPLYRAQVISRHEHKTWVQRCGGALGKLGKAHALAGALAAATGLCIASSSRH